MLQTFLLAAFLAGAIAGPINTDNGQCSTACTDTTKFGYESGNTYEFEYEAETVTKLQGASEDHSALFITATAKIEVLNKCELVLKLTNVGLKEANPRDLSERTLVLGNTEFRRHLEGNVLKFSFQDGLIDRVCASSLDPDWVINIKKGVLSAFQNSMAHFDDDQTIQESDVSGNCKAHYKVVKGWTGGVAITKTKDLLGCTDRSRHVSALDGTQYKVNSGIQALPVIKSFHDCEQTLDRSGVLTKATCVESHIFRPFSNDKSGASTTTKQTLTFSGRTLGISSANAECPRHTDLRFEHHDTSDMDSAEKHARDTLTAICSNDDVRPETPALFSRLVYILRSLNQATILRLRSSVHSDFCPTASQYLHDAIPMVGTAASVAVIRDSVLDSHVTGEEADAWLSSLAFVTNPDKDMVMNIKPLLKKTGIQAAMLSASAMVNSYCREHDCQNDEDVVALAHEVVQSVRLNDDTYQKLMTLKAITNMGVAPQSVKIIMEEATNTNNPTEVRIAAIHAFHKMTCEKSRADLFSVFLNIDEDSEIRINAYLALMKCPTEQLFIKVKAALEQEVVNQVGSFVWTHLTNLQETGDLFKQDIRKILQDRKLKKEFDLDRRKFSRNYEGSVFSELLNVGAKAESNVIWSSKSFVPRSANLNLTVDLFGQSLNLLEVGGRVEGAESLIEKVFGPNGYLPNTPVGEVLKKARENSKDEDKMKGAMYMKMFGNELGYYEMQGDNISSAKEKFNFLDILLALAKGGEWEYNKNHMFIDSSFTLPTAIGLPLKLAINGTASVRLSISGKMDIHNFDNIDVNGAIKPSAAVQIASMMTTDAGVAKTGLKMLTTLHSSTQADVMLQLQNKQIINAKLSMPRDKLEIMDVETKFMILHQGEEREQAMITQGRFEKEICTGNGLKKALGLQLCGTLAFPNATSSTAAPSFPFTGPLTAKIVLNKVDSHNSYELQARMQAFRAHRKDPATAYMAHFSLDTTGSKVDRKILIDFKLDKPMMTFDLKMASPWKKLTSHGSIVNSNTLKGVKGNIVVDGVEKIGITAELQQEEKDMTLKFIPSVEIIVPSHSPIKLRGLLIHKPGEITEGEFFLANMTQNPLIVKGSITRDVTSKLLRIDATGEINSPLADVKTSAFVEIAKGVIKSEMDTVYRLSTRDRQRVSFTARTKNSKHSSGYQSVMNSQFTSTQYPWCNWRADLESSLRDGVAKTTLDVRYNGDLKDMRKRIYFNHAGSYKQKGNTFQMKHEGQFTYKAFALHVDGKVEHRHNNRELKTNAVVNYKKGSVKLNMDVKKVSRNPLRVNGEVSVQLPGRELKLVESFEEKNGRIYQNDLSIQWQRGSMVKTTTTFAITNTGGYDMQFSAELPNKETVTFSGQLTPRIENFLASGKATYLNRIYSTSVSYSYAYMRFLNANFDLAYPGRHVTSDLSLTHTEGQYQLAHETFWDAENDPSMKVAVDGTFKYQPFIATGKLVYPSRTLNFSINHQIEGSEHTSTATVSWSNNDVIKIDTKYSLTTVGNVDLNAVVILTTPFRGFRHQECSVVYQGAADIHHAMVNINYGQQKIITLEGTTHLNNGLASTETSVSVTSPYSGFRTLNGNLTYELTSTKFTSNLKLNQGNKKYEIQLSGEKERNAFVSKMKIDTPIRQFKDMEASFAYKLTKKKLETKLQGKYGNTVHELTVFGKLNSVHDIEGSVALKTPFFDNVQFACKHLDDGTHFKTNVDAEWRKDKKIAGSTNFEYTPTGYKLNAELTTPFTEIMHCSHQSHLQLDSTKVELLASAGYNDDLYEVDISSTRLAHELISKIILKSPFAHARHIVIEVINNGGQDTPIDSSLVFNRNGKEEIKAIAKVKYNKLLFDASSQLNTVYLKPVGMSIYMQASQMPYSGNIQAQWNDQMLGIEGGLTYYGWNFIKANGKVVTPFNGFKETSMSCEHTKVESEWRSSAEVLHEKDNTLKVFSTLSSASTNFRAESSLPHLRNFQVNIRHPDLLNPSIAVSHNADYGNTIIEAGYNTSVEYHHYSAFFRLDSPNKMVQDIHAILTHENKDGDYLTDAEVSYKTNIIKLTSTVSLTTPKLLIELSTPFVQLRSAKLDITHDGDNSSFTNRVNFMAMSFGEKFFSSQLKVKGLRQINGDLNFNDHAKISVAHSWTGSQINSQIEAIYAGKKCDFILELTTGDILYGQITINTPFSSFSSIKASGEHKGSISQTDTTFMIEATLMGQPSSVSGVVRMDPSHLFKGKFQVQTPLTVLKDASINVEHSGTLLDHQTFVVVKHNLLTSSIENEFTFKFKENKIELMKRHSSPYLSYQVNFEHMNNDALKYVTTLRVTHEDKNLFALESEQHISSLNDMEGQVTFTSSWPEVRDVLLTFKHQGSSMRFTSHAEVSYNSQKCLSMDGSFNIQDYRGSFSLQTYHQLLRHLGVEFYQSGEMANFQNELKITYNDKISVLSSALQTESTVQGHISLRSPFMNTIEASIMHSGNHLNFQHTTSVKYGNINHNFITNLAVGSSIEGQMQIQSPLIKNVEVAFSHNGNWKRFSNNIHITYGSESIEATSQFDVAVREGSLTIRTPFEKIGIIQMNGKHTSTGTSYSTFGSFSYGDNQLYQITNTLEFEPFKLHTELTVPYNVIKTAVLDVSHEEVYLFKTKAELTYGDNKKYAVSSEVSQTPLYIMLSLQTHHPDVRNCTVALQHMNSNNNFKSSAKLELNGVEFVSAKTTFDFGRPYSCNIDIDYKGSNVFLLDGILDYPRQGSLKIEAQQQQLTVSCEHNGSWKSFDSIFSVIHNTENIFNMATRFSSEKDIEGSMNIRMTKGPVRQLDINITHQGKLLSFHSNGSIAYNGEMIFDGDLSFEYIKHLFVEAKVKTASSYVREGSASISYKANRKLVAFKAEVARNNRRLKADMNLKLKPSYDLSARFQAPYKYMKDTSLTVKFEGSKGHFTTEAELSSREFGLIKATGNYHSSPELQASFSLQTPFRQVGDVAMTVRHEGQLVNFKNNLRVDTTMGSLSYEGEFSTADRITGKFKVSTPFAEVPDAMVEFDVNHLQGKLTLKGSDIVDIQTEYKLQKSLLLGINIRIQSNIKYLENIIFILQHQGPATNFESSIELTYRQMRLISVRAKTTNEPQSFTLDLSIYSLDHIKVEMNRQGNMEDMKASLQVSYGRLIFKVLFSLETVPFISSQLEVSSPFHEPILMKLTHKGDLTSFETNIDGRYGSQNAKCLIIFSATHLIFEFATPLAWFENGKIEMKNNGNLEDFKMTADVSFRFINILKVVSEFSIFPTRGSFEVIVPANHIKLEFHHYGNLMVYNNGVSLLHNHERYFEYVSSIEMNPVGMSFSLYTPLFTIGNIKAVMKHEGAIKNFQNILQFSRNALEFKVSTSLDTTNMLDAKLEISTPFSSMNNIKITFSHTGLMYDFKNNLAVILNSNQVYSLMVASKVYPEIVASVTIETPNYKLRQVEMVFRHKGGITKFTSLLDFNVNGRNLAKLQISLDIASKEAILFVKQPLLENIRASFKHDGGLLNFNSRFDVAYGHDVVEGSLGMATSPFSITGELKTPFEEINMGKFSISYNSQQKNLNGELIVIGNGKTLLGGELTLSLTPDFGCSLEITEPVHLSLGIKYSGNLQSSKLELKGNLNGEPFHGVFSFGFDSGFSFGSSVSSSLENGQAVAVSFEGNVNNGIHISFNTSMLGDISFKLKHTENSGKLTYIIEGIINDKYISTNIGLNTSPLFEFEVNTLSSYTLLDGFAFKSSFNEKTNHVQVKVNNNYWKVEGDVMIQLTTLDLTVKTSFNVIKNLQFKINFHTSQDSFKTNAYTSYNDQFITLDTGCKTSDGIMCNIKMQSSIEQFKLFYGTCNIQVLNGVWETGLELSYQSSKVIGAVLQINTQPTISTKSNLKTPVSGYEDISTSLNFKADLFEYSLNSELIINGMHYSTMMKADFTNGTDINIAVMKGGELVGQLAIRNIFSYIHLLNTIQVTYGSSNFEITLECQKDPLSAKIHIKSPFTDYEELSAAVELMISSTVYALTIQSNLKGIKYSSVFKFDMSNGIQCIADVLQDDNNIAALKISTILSDHQMDIHFEMSHLHEVFIVNLECGKEPTVFAKLTVTTPFHDDFSAALNFAQTSATYQLNINAQFQGERCSAVVKIDFENENSISVVVLREQQKIGEIKFSYQLSDSNLESRFLISNAYEAFDISFEYARHPNVYVRLAMKTPLPGYEEMLVGYDFSTSPSTYILNAEVVFQNNKYSSVMKLSLDNDIAVNIELFRNEHKHAGFTFHARYGETKLESRITMFYDTYNGLDMSFECEIQAPVSARLTVKTDYSHNSVGFAFHRSASTYVLNMDLSVDDLEYSTAINGDLTDGLALTVHILEGPKQLGELVYRNKLETNHIESHIKVTWQEKVAEATLECKTEPSLSCRIIIKTPSIGFETQSAGFELVLSPSVNTFTADANFADKTYSALIIIDVSNGLHAKIMQGENKIIEFVFKNRVSKTHMESHLEVNFMNKVFALAYEVMDDTHLSGRLSIKTPFTQTISATFNMMTSQSTFMINLDVLYNSEERYNAKIKLEMTNSVEAYVEVGIYGIQTIVAQSSLMYAKSPYKLEAKVLYGDETLLHHVLSAQVSPSIDISSTIKSALTGDSSISFKAGLDNDIFSCELHLSCALKNNVDIGISIQKSPEEASIHIQTPLEYAKDISATIKKTHIASCITVELTTRYAENTINVYMAFENHDQLSVHFSVQTPYKYFRDANVSYMHKANSFVVRTEFSYMENRRLTAEYSLRMTSAIESKLTITTPFTGWESNIFHIKHSMEGWNIQSSVEVTYASTQNIYGEFNLNTENGLKCDIKFRSPFASAQAIGLVFEYQISDAMTAQVNLQYAPGKEIIFKGLYSYPAKVSTTLITPFQGIERTELNFALDMKGNRHDLKTVLKWGDKQKIRVTGSLINAGTWAKKSIRGDLAIVTTLQSLRQFSINGQHLNTKSSLASGWIAELNNRKILDIDVQYNNNNGQQTGHIILQNPLKLTLQGNVKGNINNLNVDAGFIVGKENVLRVEFSQIITSVSTQQQLRLISASRTSGLMVESSHSQNLYRHKVDFTWDEAKQKHITHEISYKLKPATQGIELLTRLDTPLRSMELQATYEKNKDKSDCQMNFYWDAARDQAKKLTLKNIFKATKTSYNNEFRLHLPGMPQDMILRNEFLVNAQGLVYSGQTEIEYSLNEKAKLVMNARLQDMSFNSNGQNYTLELGISHPSSQIDVSMVSHVANSKRVMSAGMEMNYLTVKNNRKNMVLRGEIEKIRKSINMEMMTPEKHLELNGKLTEKKDSLSVNVVAMQDRSQQVHAQMNVDTQSNTLDMKAYYSPENPQDFLHLYGKYDSPVDFTMTAEHLRNSKKITDAHFAVNNKDQVINTKIFWRPNLTQQTQNLLNAARLRFVRKAVRTMTDIKEKIQDEMTDRKDQLYSLDSRGFVYQLKNEWNSLYADFSVVHMRWSQMLENNDFYLGNILSLTDKIAAFTREKTEPIFGYLRARGSFFMGVLRDNFYYTGIMVQQSWSQCLAMADWCKSLYSETLMTLSTHCELIKNQMTSYFMKTVDSLASGLSPYMKYCLVRIDEIYSILKTDPVYLRLTKQATRVYHHALNQLSQISALQDVHKAVQENVRTLTQLLNRYSDIILNKYLSTFTNIREHVDNLITEYINFYSNTYDIHFTKDLYYKIKDVIADMEIQKDTSNFLESSLQSGILFVKKNLIYLSNKWLHLSKNRVISWMPNKGQMEFEVFMPVSLPNLQYVPWPTLRDFSKMYNKMKEHINTAISNIDWEYSPWDTYYKYKPLASPSTWVPPFDAWASIIGLQNYQTFDGRHYQFSSRCSYILVKDMTHNSFVVNINYRGNDQGIAGRSLTVMSSDTSIVINPDYTVLVNGEMTELPVELGDIEVTRQLDSLRVDTPHISLYCDVKHDICTLHLPGWLFARTGGLLGSYNNEPSDDFNTPQGTRTQSLDEFTSSWLAASCRSTRNQATHVTPDITQQTYSECSDIFMQYSSTLRPCFRIVDPSPYMAMCVNGNFCQAAAAYIATCEKSEIIMDKPKHCWLPVTTVMENNTDFVFVVEESTCNADVTRQLSTLVRQLDIAATSTGLSNTRYGLVGYGGLGVHREAHMHTLNGDIMGDLQGMQQALQYLKMGETSNNDVIAALQLATAYPFRTGAAKSIVLVTCGNICTSTPVKDDIKLHVITPHQFDLTHQLDAPRTSFIFGIDRESAYTSDHDQGNSQGDKDIFASLRQPNSQCSHHAIQSGGSFFDSSRLTSSRVNIQKKFIDVFVSRLTTT